MPVITRATTYKIKQNINYNIINITKSENLLNNNLQYCKMGVPCVCSCNECYDYYKKLY